MPDPVRALVRDHAEIDRRVTAVGSSLAPLESDERGSVQPLLASMLGELRETLFLHFAREEEGLFPFVSETVPELGNSVRAMEVAHDTICGALARAYELARSHAAPSSIAPVFRRFETAYREHARVEDAVLRAVDARLDASQRRRLAELVSAV